MNDDKQDPLLKEIVRLLYVIIGLLASVIGWLMYISMNVRSGK